MPTDENVPCYSVVTPVEGTDFISNSAEDGSGSNMASSVSIEEFAGFAETAKIVLKNSHATDTAYLTTFQLRGTPAIIVNTIKEVYENSNSVDLYGTQKLDIDNDYIDNANYAVHFNSLWTDHGGKNTTTNYKGSLREAIKKAENDFRRENGSDDTKQTRVYVDIKLEDLEYEVPKKYWSKYRSRK